MRIHGFKTFADPVALDILPGLTDLVGPNGCGRSNVVDALRWAMGEGNARTLRGAEMENVNFDSTAARPGLQQAKVALTLDNGSFPAPFADRAVVQVNVRTPLLIAFVGALRCSELMVMQLEDVAVAAEGLRLRIVRAKSD